MRSLFLAFVLALLAAFLPAKAADNSLVALDSSTPVSVPNSYYSATYVKLPYTTVIRDTGGFWDASRKEFVVPSTIAADTYGIFRCNVRWQDSGGYRVQALISKYDASTATDLQSAFPEAAPQNQLFTGGTTTDFSTVTHPVLLEPGDAYACKVWQSGVSGAAGSLSVLQSGFSLEVLQ